MILVMTIFYVISSAPHGLMNFYMMFFDVDDNSILGILLAYGTIFMSFLYCLTATSHSLICFVMSSEYRNTVKKLLGIKKEIVVVSQTPRKKEYDAARRASILSNESIKEKKLRLEIEAVQKSLARSQASRKERNAQKRIHAEHENERRSEESEEKRRCRLDSVASQAAERRNRETDDEWIARIEAQQARRDLEDEEERARRLEAMAERAEIRRAEEPEDVRQDRLEADRARKERARNEETKDQAAARRNADNQRRANRRSPLLNAATTDARPEVHYCGPMDQECAHCGALFFNAERTTSKTYTKCCGEGMILLELFDDFPDELKGLYTELTKEAVEFRKNLRQLNNSLAMGSMVAAVDVPKGGGPYTYRLHGQLNKQLGQRKRVSMRRFIAHYLHCRKGFSPLFRAGKLFQQYVVDMWTKVEQDSLNWIRHNQEQLRIEPLAGLQDYVNGEETGAVGTRILLPATHTGSPTAADIDKVISAELPDPVEDPLLFKLVSTMMMHRPCGVDNPNSPCMRIKKGQTVAECDKGFPKDFSEVTTNDKDGFAKCKRPNNGRFIQYNEHCRLTNQHVVAHNPYLLLRYQCHINLEVVGTVASVKYLYKYIHKGSARASIQIYTDKDGVQRSKIDEINQFLDTRYVCPPEAAMHLFSFEMKGKSMAVIHLAVHLPNQQGIVFKKGEEREAVANDQLRNTTLTAFFDLNKKMKALEEEHGTIPAGICDSRNYHYHEIPEHFRLISKVWNQRSNDCSTIGRMYFVSPMDRERYALRQLLLFTKGATSYEDLLNVEGTQYDTFVEAARASGYLDDDKINEQSLREAAGFQTGSQLRGFFATLLCFNVVNDARKLWDTFLDQLCDDFERNNSREVAESMAYFDILDRMDAMKKDLRDWLNLPYTRITNAEIPIDYDALLQQGNDDREKLYDEQAVSSKKKMNNVVCKEIL
ncbi:hypothetical protein CAEBREN_24573 [Caenorhabditis brenneri]|uniref:Helitron helicase-like domain-containing protein n=1 Tax=Caenorhabditis brenneri TaxID=135651 RepID=G0M9S2_CAEBE|nr:hypothetical protein CAEBREN_24573 [Caenorhabditis brenneri]